MNTKIKNVNGKIFYYEEYDNYETIPEMVGKNKNNIQYLKQSDPEDLIPLIEENIKNITINENDITTNKNDITTNKNDITTNKNDITTNKNDITTKQNKLIAGNNINIVGDTISAAGGGGGNSFSSDIITNNLQKPNDGINPLLNDITTNTNDITELENDIATNKNGIDTNSLDIISNTNDIGNIQINYITKNEAESKYEPKEFWEDISFTISSNKIIFGESVSLFSKISMVGEIALSDSPSYLFWNLTLNVEELVDDFTEFICATYLITWCAKNKFKISTNDITVEVYNIRDDVTKYPNIKSATLTIKGIRK